MSIKCFLQIAKCRRRIHYLLMTGMTDGNVNVYGIISVWIVEPRLNGRCCGTCRSAMETMLH